MKTMEKAEKQFMPQYKQVCAVSTLLLFSSRIGNPIEAFKTGRSI